MKPEYKEKLKAMGFDTAEWGNDNLWSKDTTLSDGSTDLIVVEFVEDEPRSDQPEVESSSYWSMRHFAWKEDDQDPAYDIEHYENVDTFEEVLETIEIFESEANETL